MEITNIKVTEDRVFGEVTHSGLLFHVCASRVFGKVGASAFVAGHGDDENAFVFNSSLQDVTVGSDRIVVALLHLFNRAVSAVITHAPRLAERYIEVSDEELEAQAEAEAEAERRAEIAYARDRERMAEAGSWFGRDDHDEVPF